jgi:hypothetical protein
MTGIKPFRLSWTVGTSKRQALSFSGKHLARLTGTAGGSSLYNKGTTNLYSVKVYERYNRNEEKDKSAVALKHRFQPIYDDLMTVPDLKARHHLNWTCRGFVPLL